MRAANRSPTGRIDSTRNRLILVSGCLGVATMLLGGTAIIAVVAARRDHDADRLDDHAPADHHGGTDDHGRHDHHPGTDHHGGTDDDARPDDDGSVAGDRAGGRPGVPVRLRRVERRRRDRQIQQRLLDLGFWNTGADGEYGLTTSQAVMAFQKYSASRRPGTSTRRPPMR